MALAAGDGCSPGLVGQPCVTTDTLLMMSLPDFGASIRKLRAASVLICYLNWALRPTLSSKFSITLAQDTFHLMSAGH